MCQTSCMCLRLQSVIVPMSIFFLSVLPYVPVNCLLRQDPCFDFHFCSCCLFSLLALKAPRVPNKILKL